jgi:hypothetical protein
VRDKKMLEKLATHDVQDVSKLFSLADKCDRTAEGDAWHSQLALEAGNASKSDVDAATQGSSNKKKKAGDKDKPLAGAPTTVAIAAGGGHGPRGNKHPCRPSGSDEGGQWCSVHNSKRHSTEKCHEIKNLMEQVREQQKQQ